MKTTSKKCLVSACLMGLCTRYDGKTKPNPACIQQMKNYSWIPVCPEQLGGLPTPRPPADLSGGDGHAVLAGSAAVITKAGAPCTVPFIRGAEMVLQIAKAQEISICFLKSGSPSCGLSPRPGVTAALLLQHGIEVKEF